MNFGVDPESAGCDGVHAELSQDVFGLEILSRFSQLIHGGDQPVSGLVYKHHHGLHLACVVIRGDNCCLKTEIFSKTGLFLGPHTKITPHLLRKWV